MKTGRNDPCPCGSGKKYKHCCLGKFEISDGPTEMEKAGKPNLATEAIHELREIMANREFNSEEELDEFIQTYSKRKNSQVRDDFLGLSSSDIHLMMTDAEAAVAGLVEIHGPIDRATAETIPLLRQTLFLLEELKKAPIRLTQSKYLAPDFIQRWFDAAFETNASPRVRGILRPKRESDYMPMLHTHEVAQVAGIVKEYTKEMRIEPEGERLLAMEDHSELYYALLVAYLKLALDDEAPYNDRRVPGSGHSILFGLLAIEEAPSDAITLDRLYEIYQKAFLPLRDIDNDMLLYMYLLSDCLLPAQDLGILAEKPMDNHDTETWKRTSFAKKGILWKK